MKKDVALITVMIILEILLGAYGLFNGFTSLITFLMLLIAISFIGIAYLINRKDSIYSGKFKDHFKD